jgi:malonyl-CoA O-methyltransferase
VNKATSTGAGAGTRSAYTLDKAAVRRAFDRASPSYDSAAVLQTEVRAQLLARLDLVKMQPRVVLDAGAGTGHASRALKRRYPDARVFAVDSSIGMLHVARRQQSWWRRFERVVADAEALPLPDGSVDLIFSNLLLPWCEPERVLAEFRRVLSPQGLLTLSALGPDTLGELRSAWSQLDQYSHLNEFIDMHDLGDALVRAGFAGPVLDVERYTLKYADLQALTADLRAVGARNFTAGRRPGLSGRHQWARLQNAYETFRSEGRLPATCEVVFAQAWAPAAPKPARKQDGTPGQDVKIPLSELQKQLRERRTP